MKEISREISETEVDELVGHLDFKTTAEIEIPERLVDQVIGQDDAVEAIKKAAVQKRHVMLIGSPGTGKSMLAKAMAELLPKEELEDILVYPNLEDPNQPRIRTVPAGKGKEIVDSYKQEAMKKSQARNFFLFTLFIFIIGYSAIRGEIIWGIIAAAMLFLVSRYIFPKEEKNIPKLLVNNKDKETAPYEDATGAHAGALFGDVRHDPFQSGGLETPPHERVEAGAIHRAHKGVLFIDETNTLTIESQQKILTAMQEKKFPITGQSERSSGAMVRTEPVPCDFILVAAGNLDALTGMHPALRSRIEGYGYEIYMNDTMKDTVENRRKLVRFVAQEVIKDGKIPHFDRNAVAEIIKEAKRRAGRRNHLTLRLRELGGLVRTAGDIAKSENSDLVRVEHVLRAKKIAKTIEEQLADKYIERRRDYRLFITEGEEVGRVNGLAVIGETAGVVLPIMAEVTPSLSKEEGRVIATGRLQEIAREAVMNVSAIIKKYIGKNISEKDVHIQFVGTYEGVEGDSASISIATAVISAIENIPVYQSVAMTGSLSVKGEVLPVGGVTQKIEAAIQAGMKRVIIPKDNLDDVLLDAESSGRIEIIPVSRIDEVLEYSLRDGEDKDRLLDRLRELMD
ncbi:Lon-B peptidase, Serine peptidase, MEROPS family S16 [Archaeoglobus sulfaticallidus PM70-1]|uniref:Archaeal Lon protease n=1 Tax=Archaeoglobus sulfaticallidus PM70-1 TaxID=387631 RepID=N0BDF6_9EURY|nr:ATP-dependent protease LonB [Archaeoglobus sulfaticallidus]AGK61664.1 Lon-B peptidase, Serine peptidase, MEROPS family S16 [Archaeoglobus sulfaticallidus PM70-1]